YAGEPPVRFGGRGAAILLPDPYRPPRAWRAAFAWIPASAGTTMYLSFAQFTAHGVRDPSRQSLCPSFFPRTVVHPSASPRLCERYLLDLTNGPACGVQAVVLRELLVQFRMRRQQLARLMEERF